MCTNDTDRNKGPRLIGHVSRATESIEFLGSIIQIDNSYDGFYQYTVKKLIAEIEWTERDRGNSLALLEFYKSRGVGPNDKLTRLLTNAISLYRENRNKINISTPSPVVDII